MHLFDFYRRLLMIICTVYATVRLIQAAYNWRARLAGTQRYKKVARGYVVDLALSVRVRRFWRELTEIGLLLVLLAIILAAHGQVMR